MIRMRFGAGLTAAILALAGCASQPGNVPGSATPARADLGVTFHNRVSGILQENCQACHRAGGGGPFSLVQYEEAFAVRRLIRNAVETKRMPPWFADSAHGSWANDASLSPDELRDILAWIDAGAPEGDRRDAPAAVAWPEGWNIGKPDYVVRVPSPITVHASEKMPYQYQEVKVTITEDRWVQAMQIRPSAPAVVHHVLVFIDPPAAPGERVRRQSALEGFYAAYGPGGFGMIYPDGMARLLPAGATLRFELHFEPAGEEMIDQTELGFVFADGAPERVIDTGAAVNARFVIPAGHPNFPVVGEYAFTEARTLLGFVPHMHMRGKAFRYELIHPDGREEILLDIPRYDFHWQLEYILDTPRTMPAGSRLRATGWFDNSPENPMNPDPARNVPFGSRTEDEMMIGYFHFEAPKPAGVREGAP
jgi:mono/diheme cytochrome c family protein